MINEKDYAELGLDIKGYQKSTDIGYPKGADKGLINKGDAYGSLVNKLHLIKLENIDPSDALAYSGINKSKFSPKTFVDLCKMELGACQYDAEDFLYCKNLGFPINKLITLRRFPFPCTDNIYDIRNQAEPDVARMVTYFDHEVNKLEELLGFDYNMKWKELTAEMEQASMQGDQSGFQGFSKKAFKIMDPNLAQNTLRGDNKLNYDPKHDQNKVYGPVDSITTTHIRDVGLEFNKEFEISFEYELRSYDGRTPEFAFKDVYANILACTHNNGKFWPGSRFWVGERPSRFIEQMQFMNPDTTDQFLFSAHNELKQTIASLKAPGGAIAALKTAMSNGIALAMGKLLDKLGRPSILSMNSLLSGEPTGFWHLTIGNPDNPTMIIGNLIITGVSISFPTDSLSYGDFPTKLLAKVKLKPAQPKDQAGMEMMFNLGKRIYYNPKSVTIAKGEKNNISKEARSFFGFDETTIARTIKSAFDFVSESEPVQLVTKTVAEVVKPVIDNPKSEPVEPVTQNTTVVADNADTDIYTFSDKETAEFKAYNASQKPKTGRF